MASYTYSAVNGKWKKMETNVYIYIWNMEIHTQLKQRSYGKWKKMDL